MIFVVEDDEDMARCITRAAGKQVLCFTNAVEAMQEITEGDLPELIFLDILLDGPDGFTFLNEMVSYPDTAKIPIVIVSSLDFKDEDMGKYGVVGILKKEEMLPKDIKKYVEQYTR